MRWACEEGIKQCRPPPLLFAGLGLTHTGNNAMSNPSWVPHLSDLQRHWYPWVHAMQLYKVGWKEYQSKSLVEVTSKSLHMHGSFHGKVTQTGPSAPFCNEGDYHRLMGSVADTVTEAYREQDHPLGLPLLDIIFRTVLLDR